MTQIQDQQVKEEETATFTCQLSKPDIRVKWTLNGIKLLPDDNIIITADGDIRTLTIKKCQLDDTGSVACLINEKTTQAKLKVEG